MSGFLMPRYFIMSIVRERRATVFAEFVVLCVDAFKRSLLDAAGL